jgi:hypothetical protein
VSLNNSNNEKQQQQQQEHSYEPTRLHRYVLILTEDLKSGSLQFAGTPYNVDEFFQILLSILGDRFSFLASEELSEKLSEIHSLIASNANYDVIIAKLNEAHNLMISLLLAYKRAIKEIAGISAMKAMKM